MRPADALRRHMEMGSTGSLTVVPRDAARISIYLMQGEILAAECDDDGPHLVRRLVNGGHVTCEQGLSLLARLGNALQVGDVLFGTVPDDVVMDLYVHRFQQNLADFLLADGDCEFASKEDIHVENVQVGHDSYELLERLDEVLVTVGAFMGADAPEILVLGEEPPASPEQARLLDTLPQDGALQGLLDASPFEPVQSMVLIRELLTAGSLSILAETDEPAEDDEEDTADFPVDEPGAAPLEADGDAFGEPVVVDEMDLLEPSVVDEGAMAMFADHDHSRGQGGDGIFTVSRDLLDTVDLSGLNLVTTQEPVAEELILEMEDGDDVEAAGGAVSLRFGSPPLTSEEAITKIEVTNEVLRQLSIALDDEHGSGSGQASVQLLIESARTEFAPLFVGVEATREGCMDTQRVLANIDTRPEGEPRRLLNLAMRDLVERGFTTAVERISEERFEALLERIAGYQRRLGL